jgi:hypothetical protein
LFRSVAVQIDLANGPPSGDRPGDTSRDNGFTLEPATSYAFEASWQRLGNEVMLWLRNAQSSTRSSRGMRGIVIFALMAALGAVVDAAFFQGRHLKDGQDAILGLASISTQIGRR